MKKSIVFALLLIPFLAFGAGLGERKKNAQGLVTKALAHIAKVGAEAAYRDFSDPKGAFCDGEFYIFAYDLSGKCIAHGQFPARVGKNFLDLTDPNGVKVILEHIKVAKSASGEGWDNYATRNPSTKVVENKTSFVKRVPGRDDLVGCGTYLD